MIESFEESHKIKKTHDENSSRFLASVSPESSPKSSARGEGSFLSPSLFHNTLNVQEDFGNELVKRIVISNQDYVQQPTADKIKQVDHRELIKKPQLLCNRNMVPAVWFDYHSVLIDMETACPGYLDLLEELGYHRHTGEGFIIGWRVFKCSKHGRLFYFPKAVVGCYNPFRAWNSIKASASRTLKKICSIKEIKFVGDITYTFPSEVSSYLRKNEDKEYLVWECYNKFKKVLDKHFNGQTATSPNYHKNSSTNPHKEHSHIHSILLGAVIKKDVILKTMKLVPIPLTNEGLFSHEGLSLLKREWAFIVNDVFEELNLDYKILNIRVEYVKLDNPRHKRDVLHKLKYIKRKPIVDIVEYIQKNGLNMKDIEKDWIKNLINTRNKTKIFGYWNKISRYVNRQVPGNLKICAICCSDMIQEGDVYELPSKFELLFMDRDRKIHRIVRRQSTLTAKNIKN